MSAQSFMMVTVSFSFHPPLTPVSHDLVCGMKAQEQRWYQALILTQQLCRGCRIPCKKVHSSQSTRCW